MASDDELRLAARVEVCVTLRVYAELGYEWGTAGHITVRDPVDPGLFWVNPLGVPFRLTRASDIVLVDGTGAVLSGRHRIAGFAAQHSVHRARPDNNAVVHVHSPWGFMWSSSPAPLEPLDDDSAAIHGLQAVSLDLSEDAGEALGDEARILIRKAHGFLTVGATLAEASWYLMVAERAARAQLVLERHGRREWVSEPWLSRWRLTPEFAAEEFAQHGDYVRAACPEIWE